MVINCKKEKIMKRIYSFVFAAIAILSAASCQKEIVAPEADSNATAFSFVAEREAETKTTLVNGKSTYWTPGDKVSAIDGNGVAVTFSTDITENSSSAVFACPLFTLPEDYTVHAIYPDKTGESGYTLANGVINNLRVAGTQTAVENSFDPAYAVAYAQGKIESTTVPPTLKFKNIHSLVKFTIGGDKAPSTVKLAHTGYYNLAGLYTYNITTGRVTPGEGAKAITLKPADGKKFEVGKTYYIVIIGGVNIKDMTLSFDETVVKTVEGYEGVKYADESNNWLTGKILNLGTVKFPAEEPEQPEVVPADVELTKVWSIAAIFGGGADRNMTMDSEYVYVAQAAGGNGAIKAISIADPTVQKDVKIATKVSVSTNGTHAISCVRMLPNTDPAVNNGKDVLVASNLTTGDGTAKLTIYVWTNGIDTDPNYYVIDSGSRRLGDKFTVKGTYQSGELWFWDYNSPDAAIRVAMTNGVAGLWGNPDLAYATGRLVIPLGKSQMIGEVIAHPGTTYDGDGNPKALLATSNVSYGFVNQSNGNVYALSTWGKDPKLAQTFGYKFFDFNGNNYIAYVQIPSERNNAVLNVIKDIKGAADFQGTLEAKAGLVTANLLDTNAGDYTAGHGVGDCATVVVDGVRYIAVQGQNMGVALYKLSAIN